jgi:hypothetical protein
VEHVAKLDDEEKRRVDQEFANGMPGSDPGIYNGPRPATLISDPACIRPSATALA